MDREKPLWLGQSERGRAAWGEVGPGSWTRPRMTFPGCWGLCFVFRVQQERWHLTGSRSLGTKEKLRLGEGEGSVQSVNIRPRQGRMLASHGRSYAHPVRRGRCAWDLPGVGAIPSAPLGACWRPGCGHAAGLCSGPPFQGLR